MVTRALSLLRPGGVLILRTHGGACIESVVITRSVQIVGDVGPDVFGPYTHAAFPLAHAVLVAPPGQPCISVAPGVRAVSLRGLVINAPDAGGAPCIQARDAAVEVRDSVIRYLGLGSAINVEGGIMLLKNLGVAARTPAPAVISEGADVKFEDLRIATTQIGLLVEPGPGESQLTRVFARALDGGLHDDAHPTTGLMVRGGAPSGHVDVLDAVMLGFSNGARFDHDVKADLRYGHIGWSRVGVLTEGLVGVRGMTIGAAEVGVYVRSGAARVILNRIYGVRYAAIFADPGARVWAAGNWVYPGPDCGFFRDPRYNATGQACRPWTELPEGLRAGPAYAGSFQDGWSEWNYDWGYDSQTDAWRTGPGAGPGPGPGPGFGAGAGPGPGSGPGFGAGAGPGGGPGPGFGAGPGPGPGPGSGPGFGAGPGPGGGPGSGFGAGAGPGPGSGPGFGAGAGPGGGPGPGFGAGPGPAPVLVQAQALVRAQVRGEAPVQASVRAQAPVLVRAQALVRAQVRGEAPVQASVRAQAPVLVRAQASVRAQVRGEAPVQASVRAQAPVRVRVQASVRAQVRGEAPVQASVRAQAPVQAQASVQAPVQAPAPVQALEAQAQGQAQGSAPTAARRARRATIYWSQGSRPTRRRAGVRSRRR